MDELDNLLQNMIESGGNFVNYMMKLCDDNNLMLDIKGMTPNTYGCERIFVSISIFSPVQRYNRTNKINLK